MLGIKNENKSLVLSFYSFLRNPKHEVAKSDDKRKIWTVFRLWSLVLAVIIVTQIPISILIDLSNYDQEQNFIFDLLFSTPLYLIIFLFYIWAPLSEELAFRMAMKYSPFRLSFSVSISLLMFLDYLVGFVYKLFPEFANWAAGLSNFYFIIIYVSFILFFGFGFGYFLKREKINKNVSRWYKQNFSYVFYILSLCFGLGHILNYYNFGSQLYILPLLVWPQFVIGLALGYVRMIFGLHWSVFMHFFHNFVFSAPFLALAFLSDNLIQSVGGGDEGLIEQTITSSDILIILSVFLFSSILLVLVVVAWFSLWFEYRKARKSWINY